MLAGIRQNPTFIYLRTTHYWLPITNDGDEHQHSTHFTRLLVSSRGCKSLGAIKQPLR